RLTRKVIPAYHWPATGKVHMPSWKLLWSKVSSYTTNVLLKKTVTGNVIKHEFSINNGLKVEYKKPPHSEVFYNFKLCRPVLPESGQYIHQTRTRFLNRPQVE